MGWLNIWVVLTDTSWEKLFEECDKSREFIFSPAVINSDTWSERLWIKDDLAAVKHSGKCKSGNLKQSKQAEAKPSSYRLMVWILINHPARRRNNAMWPRGTGRTSWSDSVAETSGGEQIRCKRTQIFPAAERTFPVTLFSVFVRRDSWVSLVCSWKRRKLSPSPFHPWGTWERSSVSSQSLSS